MLYSGVGIPLNANANKQMSKNDWKQTAVRLATDNRKRLVGSRLAGVATLGASKAGIHPLVQLGLQLATKPAAGKLWDSFSSMMGTRVNTRMAKKIVQTNAPGTPIFAIKQPIPGGSLYVPPVGRDKSLRKLITTSYGEAMSKRDLNTLQSRGGVLLAPLDRKARTGLGQVRLKSKFRRVT